MAIHPCDYGRHRYPEPQQSVYVIRPQGVRVIGGILRLCPKHFRLVVNELQEVLSLINEETEVCNVCESCGADEHGVVFARCFPAKSEEVQLAADLCLSCYTSVVDNIKLAQGRPLQDRSDRLP